MPKAFLWGNRNVLEISCHVDNWIALCAGEQTSYMVHRVPWIKHKLSLENAFRKGASIEDGYNSVDHVVGECAKFENCRFLCQMAIIQPESCHFDKSFTFLGCSMEMLRTSLAKWVEKCGTCDEGFWRPRLFSNGGIHGRNKKELIPFEGNDDFTECLRSLRNLKDMTKSFVKMRVLWELQNHFQSHLQNNEVAPNSLEAIALCILSFPAVSVDVRDTRDPSAVPRMEEWVEVFEGREECIVAVHGGTGQAFQIENYEYVIRASCGPQDLQLILSLTALQENSNSALSLCLSEIEGRKVDFFDWEVWRNAFYGRLEACRLWKKKVGMLEKVGMRNFAFVPPSEHINAGIQKVPDSSTAITPEMGTGTEMFVWKGWLPHVTSICVYEIATEGFILQATETEGVPIAVTVSEECCVQF